DARRLLRELHCEVSLAAVSPGLGGATSGEGIGSDALERCGENGRLAVCLVAVFEIDKDVPALRTGGKGIAMQASALGNSQLGANAIVFEQDGVVSRCGVLIL